MHPEMTQPAPRARVGGQARALLGLGLPLVGSHIAQVAIMTTDLVMIGWYDVTSLAALTLAVSVFHVVFIFGSGFAWAVMPMVARADALGDDRQTRRVTRMALWLSAFLGLALMPLFLMFDSIFVAAGQDAEISRLAGVYMLIMGIGLVPALMVMVLKSYLSALELTRSILVATLAGAVLNVGLNYVLIFGKFGAPELGIAGAGVASVIGHIFAFGLLAVYAVHKRPDHDLFRNVHRPDWSALRSVFQLGWPIGLTHLSEVALFAAASVMMGWFGTISLAAHGIALQISSITFMIHVGLSQAVTVRVGQASGRGNHDALRAASLAGMMLSLGTVAVTILLFLTVPQTLIGLFVDPDAPSRPEILVAGAAFLAVAALFQLGDAAQVMALGMLRGVQDTRIPMFIAVVSYWLVGLPISYLLGVWFGLAGIGIWIGLTMGLACAGIFLQIRFWTRHA